MNYVDAECFYPLTVNNKIVTEAAFAGEDLVKGRKQTTLVMFLMENGEYTSETHVFDENGAELKRTGNYCTDGRSEAICCDEECRGEQH